METTDATEHPVPYLLGVNYWPRKKAMFWWKRFDTGEVESEFAEIQEWRRAFAHMGLKPAQYRCGPESCCDASARRAACRRCIPSSTCATRSRWPSPHRSPPWTPNWPRTGRALARPAGHGHLDRRCPPLHLPANPLNVTFKGF